MSTSKKTGLNFVSLLVLVLFIALGVKSAEAFEDKSDYRKGNGKVITVDSQKQTDSDVKKYLDGLQKGDLIHEVRFITAKKGESLRTEEVAAQIYKEIEKEKIDQKENDKLQGKDKQSDRQRRSIIIIPDEKVSQNGDRLLVSVALIFSYKPEDKAK